VDRFKPIEHGFKAAFFKAFSPMLRKNGGQFRPLNGEKIAKVLFLRPERIGDMAVSFPVFDGLKQRYPNIAISILGSPKNYPLIKHDPRFDRVFLYTKNILKDLQTLRAIRRCRFDCVIDMICDDSVTALFLSQLCAPGKPRIGVGKTKFREYYDFNYDSVQGDTGHIIDNTLKLLEAFGIDSTRVSGYAPPHIDADSARVAEEFLARLNGGSSSTFTVGYNLSAGHPSRVWPAGKSAQLIQRIIEHDSRNRVILFATPAEREAAVTLAARFGDQAVPVPENLSLIGASALIGLLDVMITPDTSLAHIARSLKTPVVGFYTRFTKNFLLWKPYDQEIGAVVSDSDHNIHGISIDKAFETYLAVCQQNSAVGQ
jgi:ADP-heptose:LPS heptosyltransferase